jgi:hypothetical protein
VAHRNALRAPLLSAAAELTAFWPVRERHQRERSVVPVHPQPEAADVR